MKKIKYYIVVLFATLVACDDKLDLSPISEINELSFYQSEDDFEAAILGAYSTLRLAGVYGDIHQHGGIRSDDTDPELSGSVTTITDIDQFQQTPENTAIQDIWVHNYEGVNQVNLIINNLDTADIDAGFASAIRSEAQFLRAVFYFRLVVSFGNIPILTESVGPLESFEVPQSTPDSVFSLIISDLSAASSGLPAVRGDAGRATSGAASALAARVHITQGNYNAAIPELNSVISSGNFSLQPTYAEIFDPANEYNSEILFAVRYSNLPDNQNEFQFFVQQQPNNTVTMDLINEYELGDKRFPVTIGRNDSDSFDVIVKYNLDGDPLDGEEDRPIIRYADVLLMLAEALNEGGYEADGEAFQLLNQVRTRDNNLSELTSVEVPDQASFRSAIEHERRIEFAGEALRWFDLLRTNRFIEVMSDKGFDNISEKDRLYPIPQREIDIVGDETILGQNPGY